MSYLIDIILVGVIALIVFLSSRKGIILTLVDLIAGFAAFAVAKIIAPFAAEGIYNSMVKNIVVEFLTEKYAGIESSISDALANVTSAFDFLPEGILSYVESSGFLDSDAIASGIMSEVTTVAQLETQVVAPVVIAILNLLCFAVLSMVLLIAFKFVGRFASRLVKAISITKRLDGILGGVFGFFKGALYAVVIAAVISVVSFSSETLATHAANSYICSFVAGLMGF